jgi:hypothetical protein
MHLSISTLADRIGYHLHKNKAAVPVADIMVRNDNKKWPAKTKIFHKGKNSA